MVSLLSAIGLVIIGTVIGSVGALFVKLGANKLSRELKQLLKNHHLMIGGLLYGLSTVPFLIAIKFGELSVLYPFVSLSYVWTVLISIKYLKEKVNYWAWVGVAFIIIGVSFIGFGA